MSIRRNESNLLTGYETTSKKDETMKILFSDEKTFDIDAAYDSQNDLIRMVSRSGADIKGGARQKRNFPPSCYGTSQVAYSNI